MTLGCSRLATIALVWFISSCLVTPLARGQGQVQPRRSIELSETNSAQILTNLNLLSAPRSLEEQLRSLKTPSSQNSIEDRFSVPYMAPTVLPNSKRLKELLDRNKNWALTAEELKLVTGSRDSDPLATFTDDKNDSRKSLQQFYDTLTRPPGDSQTDQRFPNNRSAMQNQNQNQDGFDTGGGLDDDSTLPASLREKTQKLRNIVSQDPGNVFNPAKPVSSFDNFFGLLNPQTPSAQEETSPVKTQTDSFLEQYKKGLDPATVLGLNPALSALLPNGNSLRTTVSPDLTKLPATVHQEAPEPTALVGSVPDPTKLSDLNATVLNQWNPLYSPPKLELPHVNTAPSIPLNYEYPRRRF